MCHSDDSYRDLMLVKYSHEMKWMGVSSHMVDHTETCYRDEVLCNVAMLHGLLEWL